MWLVVPRLIHGHSYMGSYMGLIHGELGSLNIELSYIEYLIAFVFNNRSSSKLNGVTSSSSSVIFINFYSIINDEYAKIGALLSNRSHLQWLFLDDHVIF
jgi:hypothetical protein